MSRTNKLISTVVLICFVFNAAVSDLAFGQSSASGTNTGTLAAPLKLGNLEGIEHKDIGDIELWFMACLTYLNKQGWEINSGNIRKFRDIKDARAKNVLGNTIFQMPNAKFLIGKTEDMTGGRLRIKVKRGGKIYYAEYSPKAGGTMTVYPAGKASDRNMEDALAVEAYKYHERLDEVMAFAHENGIAKEPYNYRDGRAFFPAALRTLYDRLNIETNSPDPEKIPALENRKLVLIPLNDVIKEKLKEKGVLRNDGECPVARILYEGRLLEVSCYMTSSNNRVHAFVSPDIYEKATRKSDLSDNGLTALERHITRHLVHEIGVMCGLEYSVENGILKNALDRMYDGSVHGGVASLHKYIMDLVDLDNVKGRDYATDMPQASSAPEAKKPGKSPKDVFEVIAATKRFLYSEFTMFDYIAAHKSHAKARDGWDPDFDESDFRKIFQTNSDSFLKKGHVATSWGAGGELRFKLTPSGRAAAGISEIGGGAVVSAKDVAEDNNVSFECNGLMAAFDIVADRKRFPFNNNQIIAALRQLVESSDGNLNDIMSRGSIQSIQFSTSGEGSVTGYVVVLNKIGAKIELCVKAKGLPDDLIKGTVSVSGQAAAAVQAKADSTVFEGLGVITALSQELFDHNVELTIDGYRVYTDTARKVVGEIAKALKFTDLRDVHKGLLELASKISNMPGADASQLRKKEAQAVSDIISEAAGKLAEEFPKVLEETPAASVVITPKIHAPATTVTATAMPAASGPSQSAIALAERSFDVLHTSEQRSGISVISLQYLEGVARDLKAGLLHNRLERVIGLLNRVKVGSKNPACKAMASQAIVDYNRITGNPTAMIKPSAPATAAITDWSEIEKLYPKLTKVRTSFPEIIPVITTILANPVLSGLSQEVEFFEDHDELTLVPIDRIMVTFTRKDPDTKVELAKIIYDIKCFHRLPSSPNAYDLKIFTGDGNWNSSYGVSLHELKSYVAGSFDSIWRYLKKISAADAGLERFDVNTSVPLLRSPIDQEARETAGFNRRQASAARVSSAQGPNDITDIEMAPNIRFMIGNIIGQYGVDLKEYNFQLLEAVRTGFISTRGEALPRLEEILPSIKIGMADTLYNQLVGMRAMAMMDSPAPAAGSAGKSEVFGERYAELALMPGLTLFRYQESAGKPVILIRVMAPGRLGTFNFGEVTEIAAFAERNGSLRKIDVPAPCAEIIRFIRENAGDGTISVLAMRKTTAINIPSTGLTINIKDGKMNVSRGIIMGDQLNTGPVLPTPDAIGPHTGFAGPEVAAAAVLTGDLERGKEIIRTLQANLYEFIDRNQENQDATVALLAVRDGLITSMREGYNPETVYQRLYELYGEMNANGEVAGIIARNMQVFAANFTEPGSVSQEMVAEEVVEATPAEEYTGVKPAKDMALPSIVPQGETGLDDILGLVPVDWIDGTLDVGTMRDALKEAISSNTLSVADDLWDGKLGLIFSERVTFGELLSDGSYDEGLGILLPNIIKSDVRIAVVATTDRQRALIEEINAQILSPEQKIVCGATVDEARLGLRNSARFCYFRASGEKDADGIPSIEIIVKKIINAIGKIVNITNSALIEQMHEAARRFAEAA